MFTKYSELTNSEEMVRGNAGLIAIKFFMKYGVKEIALAGFDGYSYDIKDNYVDNQMSLVTKSAVNDAMNRGMSKILSRFGKKINLYSITKQRYVLFLVFVFNYLL